VRGGYPADVRTSIPLGRLAGITVGVNWSVLVIFVLIAWGLGARRFPRTDPGLPAGIYIGAGLSTAVVFFACLLAHELSHALVAGRNGMQVEGVTLWLFGGMTRLSGEVRTPTAELRFAGIGPLVSLCLGVAFGAAWYLQRFGAAPGLVGSALFWLGAINIALAVFNVIPAAPLDGGRLLRAVIWWRTGDQLKATRAASRAGQVLGWILVALGLFRLFALPGFDGLWLALVGWFLVHAATTEARQADILHQLAGITVAAVMTPEPTTVPGSTSVAELLDALPVGHHHASFPLAEPGGPPEGLVTLTQLRRVSPNRRATTRLRDIACRMDQIAQAEPEESAAELMSRLSECTEGRALVLTNGRLVGIVSPSDLNRALRTSGSSQA